MLAETFVEVLREGGLFYAVVGAGRRIDKQEDSSHEYVKLFNEYTADPTNDEKRKAVEAAEAAY
eukprot:4379464-Lingulodinium_polyedra.AAC.1